MTTSNETSLHGRKFSRRVNLSWPPKPHPSYYTRRNVFTFQINKGNMIVMTIFLMFWNQLAVFYLALKHERKIVITIIYSIELERKCKSTAASTHTENFFRNLIKSPDIRLYLPFSDWHGFKRTSVWIHINRKKVNTTWFQVDLTRFWKYFSVRAKSSLLGAGR